MAPESNQTHLYSVRVWKETTEEDTGEYRGQIRHVVSGETRHFRTWLTLIEFIVEQIEQGKEFEDGSFDMGAP